MSVKKEKFLCAECNYPAQNNVEFFDPDTELIIQHCPNCNSRETIPQKLFDYKLSWGIINSSGTGKKIRDLGGVYLKLEQFDTPTTTENFVSENVPSDVLAELNDKVMQTKIILQNSDLFDTLKAFNVRIGINATTSRSE